jgi:hypothetical protein
MSGFKNLVINGGMQIAQRGTSFTGLTNGDGGTYTLDRWRYSEGGTPTGVIDIKQTADHPLHNGYCLEIDVTTAQTSYAAGDDIRVSYRIEGQHLQQLRYGASGARPLAFSFWAKSAATGTYSINLYQHDGDRSFVSTYTISAANTWEYKTVSIPGDASGQIDNDNGKGLSLQIELGGGTDAETSNTDQWIAGGSNRATGDDNILATTEGNLRLADIQLEVGEVATPFEQRDVGGVELALCQRYFEKSYDLNTPVGDSHAYGMSRGIVTADWTTRLATMACTFAVTKRERPDTIWCWSRYGTANYVSNDSNNLDSYAVDAIYADERQISAIDLTTSAAANSIHRFHWAVSAEL